MIEAAVEGKGPSFRVRELPDLGRRGKGVSVLRILIERREADMEAERVSEQ